MARLSPSRAGLALFVVLLVHTTTAEEKCRSGCHGVNPTHFKYAEGTTYKYNLESAVDITLSSAEGQSSSTKLKATVLLTQQANCNQVLRLQNVQLIGSDGKKHGTIPNLEKAVKLNNHDGHIEDVICVEHGDTQVSLNIKRAVASLFQAALDRSHETDVFGVCPTDIQTSKDGNLLTIKKSRSLNKCSHREHAKHDFMATAFNLHSEIKSSPLLKSTYHSEQKVKDGILDHVLVTEDYFYVPFSVGNNGAKATVQTKLQLAGKSKDAPKVKCSEPKSILFENPHPLIAPKSDVNSVLQAVKDTSNSIGVTVGDQSAGKFRGLIKILGAAKKDDLLSVYNQVRSGAGFNDKATAKKVFLDALYLAGTGESVEVAIELLKSKQLSPLEQKLVYLGLNFVRHATPNSLASAASLLDMNDVPREAYLGVGSLAAGYCKHHDCSKNIEQLKKLYEKLVSKLKDGKATNRKQENEIISVLKALGNTRWLSDAVIPKITSIAQDKKAPTRVRIAALETYLADSCKDKIRDSALHILQDIQQDSEIRIKAYLAAAQCPNGKTAAALKKILDNEPSYQVGGFIVSHIRNLRASANPDKELAKRELANVNTVKHFPIDPRKFSINSELSYAFDTLGMSSSAENNLIYSQNSFLPRSTCLNLTAEVFGHKFNFLEIDARQENLDKLVEHYLGPLSALRNKKPEELAESGVGSLNKILDQVHKRLTNNRGKRHVPKSEVDAISKQVQLKSNDLNTDLDLDLSLKVLGSEILFLNVNENNDKFTAEQIIDRIFDKIDSGIDKAMNFDHVFNSNTQFLDAELSYPTSMGLVLRLGVEGTSAVQVKAAGSFDIRALLGNKDTFAKLTLIPSANIQVAGKLTIDCGIIETGLEVISTLHTATGTAEEIEFFKGDNGVDMKLSFPLEKMELFSAKHEIVFCNREASHPPTHTPLKFMQSKDFSICVDQLDDIIGLTPCVEINYPNYQLNQGPVLPFPFSGPSNVAVWIERSAPITLHLREVLHNEPGKLGYEFVLETLENNQRKVSLLIEGYAAPEKYIKATLDSPMKKAIVEGRITDNDKEKSISAKFAHDDQEYSGKLGVAVSGTDAKAVYTPLIQYIVPGQGAQKSPYTVEGTITAEKNGDNIKYTFNDVKLIAPNQNKPITITGNVGRTDGAYFSDLTLNDGSNTGSLKGSVKVSKDLIKLDAEMKNSLSPLSNFHIDYELARTENSVSNALQFAHGNDLSNKLTLSNSITRKFVNSEDYHVSTKNKLSYPLMGIDAKLDFIKLPKSVEYDVEAKYNKVKVASKMGVKYNQKVKGDYDFQMINDGLENKIVIKAKRDITGDKSKVSNSIDINGKKIEAAGTITHHIKNNEIDVGTQMTFKAPQLGEPLTVDHGLTVAGNDLNSHLKISRPSVVYVDFDLKAHKIKGANGHLKVNLQDALKVDGELKADKWNGKSHILVELPKLQRKLKAESTFNLNAPTFNIDTALYPNFEKDAKKITFTTNNNILKESFDSKNVLDAFGQKLQADIKGAKEGELMDGKLNGEFEVILPNEMYFAGKYNQERHIKDDILNANVYANLEQRKNKNTPGQKASLKATAQNVNTKEHTYEVVYNLGLDDSTGKNLNADMTIKRAKEGEERNNDLKLKLYGSIMPETLEISSHYKRQPQAGNYNIKANAGPKLTLTVDGKYDVSGRGTPLTNAFNLELQTPNPKIKTVLISTSGSLLNTDDNLEMKSSGKLFVDDDGTDPEATIDISGESDIKLAEHHGQVKGNLKVQKLDPMSFALGYGHKDENGVSKCQADVSLQYAKGKNIKGDVSLIRPSPHEYKLDLKLDTPFEQAKNTQVSVHTKRAEDKKSGNSDMSITVDGKKHVVTTDYVISDVTPSLKIEVTHPDGKIDRLVAKANAVDPKHYLAELSLAYTPEDISFDGSIDAKIQSVEDFDILVKLDAPKLKMDKLSLAAKNQNNKAAKVIEIEITSAGKNLIKGSANYKIREDGGKYIVEGSGEFNVQNEKKTGNFKFIRQNLNLEKNNEQGIEIRFDAGLGSKAIDAELKLTNKQFRILNSFCEEKKQCAHFEIDSKSSYKDISEYNHELEVNIDLRKLGLAHEFGLKVVTNRKHLQLDHTVDIHFQSQENNNYQFSLYLHPKEAGVSFTTPKRQVAAEGHFNVPEKGKSLKGELAFYLNKKAEPGKKTSISANLEYIGDQKRGGVKADAKFTTPGLSKDLAVKLTSNYDVAARKEDVELILDIFAKPNQKIIITSKQALTKTGENGLYSSESHASIKSAGMGIDINVDQISFSYDSNTRTFKRSTKATYNVENRKLVTEIITELSPSKIHLKLQLLNNEIYDIQSKLHIGKEQQQITTEARIIGMRPSVSTLDIKNYNTMKYTLNAKETPDKQLVVNSALIPGQIADFRAEVGKQELVRASLKLDEANFLKPDYGMSMENIEKLLLKPIYKEFSNSLKEGKVAINKVVENAGDNLKQIRELTKKNSPNLKPVRDYYQSELDKLKEEVSADKTVQAIGELLKNIFGASAQILSEILTKLTEINEQILTIAQANIAKISELLEKDILPRVRNILDNLVNIGNEWLQSITDIIFSIMGKIGEIIDAHQAEFKQLATSLSAIAHDLGRYLQLNYDRISEIISKQVKKLYDEIKALPLYDEIKARYAMIVKDLGGFSEPLNNMLKDALNTLRDVIPNEDIKKVIESISDYIEKKIRNEAVDDIAAIENIIRNLIISIKKLVAQLNVKEIKLLDPTSLSVDYLYALPRLVSAKFSPLNHLARGPEDSLDTLRETMYGVSFNPRSWVPPFRLYAFVVQGQHIFTFDGKHVTFPGNCNYLLARDAVNGNFTIAGTYTKGLLTALTVADKTDSITLKKGGQVMVNKDATEFPVRRPTIEGYRLYNSVNVASKAGVEVRCDSQLTSCTFSISGFYHGQLRGLLGNGNNEPYDDFTTATNKIVTSESDFGNSYKMAASCAPVKTVDHASHQHAASCNELFSQTSTLRFCYPFVNTHNFRVACDHGVAAGVKDTEQAIATGYVAACNAKFIPIRLPEQFVKCKNGDQERSIGDKFTVKLPAKAADVVIVVDQVKSNEAIYKELVQPLANELTKEFGSKGVNDVEFHVVGYGGEYQRYPSHFTNGGKLSWKGKLPAVKFSDAPEKKPIDLFSHRLNALLMNLRELKHDADLATGCDLQSRAFVEVLKYPFRANAAKLLVAFTGSPCEQGEFLLKLRASLYNDKSIHVNLVTPFKEFKVKDPKISKTVVGFDDKHVYTFADAKKKSANSELHKDLEYNDFCVDHTIKRGGTVFNADNFLGAKGKPAKTQFVQVMSHNLVDQVMSVEKDLACECKYYGTLQASNQCRVVSINDK